MSTHSTPATPRAARRARAQAELHTCDAAAQADTEAAEADWAEQEVVRRGRAERHAALSAQLDELDAFAKEQARRADEQAYADVVRRQEAMDQLRRLATEPLPHVPLSRA